MYCGYVTTIRKIRKHPNADRLQIATVFDNDVVVDLNFSEGQQVVYFPSDGQLSEVFARANDLVRRKDENGNDAGGYLDPEKRNIRAIRLRGEKSDGLILPIDSLANFTDVSTLWDGQQITILNGVEICRKYIPMSNAPRGYHHSGAQKKNGRGGEKFPFFAQHIDTEQLAYNQSAFKPQDTIYLTQKLHGTSFRVANSLEITTKKRHPLLKMLGFRDIEMRNWRMVSGTRRVVLDSFDGGFYGDNAFRKPVQDFFEGKLPKGMEVFGEIVGWANETTPIMPRCNNAKVNDKEFSKRYGKETIFTYGCEPGESHFYVYRITMTNEDGDVVELPTEAVMRMCETWGCDYVPLLEKFMFTTWEDLNERCEKYLDVPEPLANGSHVTEGVVVRIDNRSKFTAYKTKSYAFKVLEGIIKDTSSAPDMEEAEELIDGFAG